MTRVAYTLVLLLTLTAASTHGQVPTPQPSVVIDTKKLEAWLQEQKQEREAQQRKRLEERDTFFLWVRCIGFGLAAVIGGALGARGVLTGGGSSTATPATPHVRNPATPRVRPLGLGADGKGGVWLREVPPWEK
jgi:hypothetical protein